MIPDHPSFVQAMIGANGGPALPIHLGDRIIDGNQDIDIATFCVTAEEVERLGRVAVSGFQRSWPPPPARIDHAVTLCGFPGEARRWSGRGRELVFGCTPVGCLVTSARSTCISLQLERDRLTRVLGDGDLRENYDFGGISGGPVLAIVERGVLRGWTPVAVPSEGPNSTADTEQAIQGLEIIRARPLNFINADGTLDLARWQDESQTI